ncbi:ATP-binding protein, partial [Vibrio sp. FNV 38]|nr:ATP-binding protein [Vibrio sp. FNV 38]
NIYKRFYQSREVVEQISTICRGFNGEVISIESFHHEGYIFTDKERLTQIVINFLSNAIKFSPEGSLVQLRYSVNREYHTWVIADRGIGMSSEEIELMKIPFHQIGALNYRKGSGLGVSISLQLIKELGGVFYIKSRKGRGTLIKIKFKNKIFDKYPLLKKDRDEFSHLTLYSKVSILIVEDSEINQRL